MTPSSHSQAAKIARQLLEAGPMSRGPLLDRACGNDQPLRDLVLRLVAQEERATLASGFEQQAAAAVDPALVGKRVGSYTILRVLGEGGMGTVYLAEQDRPRRVVALKVVRAGLMSSRLIRRFEIESQALARLRHPGIAQIYETAAAETPHGAQPFYAMEYVDGDSLTAYARDQKLTARQRIVMFLKVCDAVQHAHQKGVIHRDLKPVNILVEADGQPKILDFGIARLTDDRTQVTEQTEAGQLLGTLAYMSPEQVSGDPQSVDTRTDVYAMGVILYELLAGRLPLIVSDKSVPEAVRAIVQDEPTALGVIDRELRGDLQTIVAKAMEKERSRRYASASELGADLRRFLDDQPILARPPSRVYQVRKFTARNRALVGGAGVALLALIGGAAATTWQAIEATRGWTRAEAAQSEAKTEAANAKAVAEFLTRMLAAASPDVEGEREVSVREMVDRAADELRIKPIDDQRVDMTIRDVLATTYRGIGHAKEAEVHARSVLSSATALYGAESINATAAKRNLANLLSELGRFDEAEAMQKDAQAYLERTLGPGHTETALCKGEMGSLCFQRGRFEEAERLLRDSLRVIRPALGETNRDVLTNLDHLGSVLTQLGRFDEAESTLREVLAARERAFGSEHAITAFTLNSLANVVQKQGRNEEAIEMLKRALAIRRKRLEPNHPSLIVNVQNLAVALAGLKKYEEAEPLLRECARMQTEKLGADHPKTLVIVSNLAFVVQDLGKLDEAEELYRGIIRARERTKADDSQTWIDMNNLAMLVQMRGRLDEAAGIYADIMKRCEGKLPAGHYVPAIFQSNYGECLTALKRFEEAEPALLSSQEVLTKFFKAGHPRVKKGLERIAALYEAWGKPEKAREYRDLIATK